MRQIPKYGIIGSGRVAKHFIHYFNLLNIEVKSWSRSTNTKHELESFSKNSDIVLILIKDDEIENFINANHIIQSKIIIHFSGCLSTDKAIGIHPLVSFGETLYELEFYKKIAFIIDNQNFVFHKYFPFLANEFHFIDKKLKPYYHALCVMSGNFSVILWAKLFNELESKFNITKEAAYPYLESIFTNIKADHNKALTGPLSRDDQETINKNLLSLKEDPFHNIYKSFLKLFQRGNNGYQ
ncbi:MAG: DUF2520 domain-containing protein [Alphaproteobacteria bacterium]